MKDMQNYISSLMDKYGNTVLRVAFTYMKNRTDAEDIVQDVFLKIIEKDMVFEDDTHAKYWLIRVTANMCKNRLTSFWNRNKCSDENMKEDGVFDTYDEGQPVLEAVMSLPDKYKTAVYMYYYEDLPVAEIAKALKKNETTVRSYLFRAREKLKDLLKEEYDFE